MSLIGNRCALPEAWQQNCQLCCCHHCCQACLALLACLHPSLGLDCWPFHPELVPWPQASSSHLALLMEGLALGFLVWSCIQPGPNLGKLLLLLLPLLLHLPLACMNCSNMGLSTTNNLSAILLKDNVIAWQPASSQAAFVARLLEVLVDAFLTKLVPLAVLVGEVLLGC